jgi:glycosyltransferase involved in cell wall biosynthesis
MRTSLIILTLNEIVGVRALFATIPLGAVDEVLVVDGGSTDGTIEFFRDRGVRVIVQDTKGRGEAFRLAFARALGDALIFFSPDGNEDPADVINFKHFLDEGYDLVIATRMVKGARNEEDHLFFPWRKWVNKGFTVIANCIWNRGSYVTDTINGYRAITKDSWEKILPDGAGYTIEYQSSIRAFKKNLKIKEFPTIEGRRLDQGRGSPGLKTGIAFLKILLKETLT